MRVLKRETIGTHAILVLVARFAVYPLASIIVRSFIYNSTSNISKRILINLRNNIQSLDSAMFDT